MWSGCGGGLSPNYSDAVVLKEGDRQVFCYLKPIGAGLSHRVQGVLLGAVEAVGAQLGDPRRLMQPTRIS
jgi:hypothetical protein